MRIKIVWALMGLILLAGAHAAGAVVINNDEVSTVTDTTAIITWKTDLPSDTRVYAGIGYIDPASPKYSSAESATCHYAVLTGLSSGTTYHYYLASGTGDTSSTEGTFTTLIPPSGNYLFSFATINDSQYADGKLDTVGARGRPYSKSAQILDAMVQAVNRISQYDPSVTGGAEFTILKGDQIEDSVAVGDLYFPYGDDVFNVEGSPKYAGQESVRQKLNRLTHNNIYPIPGNHDKISSYTSGNWVTANLGKLYPAMAATDPAADSDFNYSFVAHGCRFIMLDSMRSSDGKASVEAGYLSGQLSAAQTAGQKCFIFLHHPVTDIRSEHIPDDVIKEVSGGTLDYDKIQIMNTAEVQSLISQYQNVIAGVFCGHIHDNHYSELSGVPCVRTSAGIQFPTTFNIYKVYTNGFMQSSYKVPYWTEVARDTVKPQSGYSDIYWEQFALGPVSARNFSHTLASAAPQVDISKSSPANGSAGVPLNESVRIVFTKAMSPADAQNALTWSQTVSVANFQWSQGNTVLTVNHMPFVSSTNYTVTIGTGARDASGTAMAQAYAFTFTTGTSSYSSAPTGAFDRFPNDVTTDNQPVITGIATDTTSAIVSIECSIDGGAFSAASPIGGAINALTEKFAWVPPLPLTRGVVSHEAAVRCRNAAGNTGSNSTYRFYVIGDRPEIGLQSLGTAIINGDKIARNPSFGITVISNKVPVTAKSYLKDQGTGNVTITGLTLSADPSNSYLLGGNYSPTLSDGIYTVRIEAADSSGRITSREVVDLAVQTGADLAIQGTPLNFPNPFDPDNGPTSIAYTLSKSADITLNIYDLMGGLVVKKNFGANSEGGKAGYNEASWDGKDNGGHPVGNGLYIYLIIGNGNVLGKGKITVLK
ncbi:MAG TPA: Ig-like domain-containing protein [Candidatus Omnitrophota bacterium]|nr:Ig-like domain-containing protein [Candidatus Omnitrophota bacterium]